MKYSLVIDRRAFKFLNDLAPADRSPIISAINSLSENPRPHGCKKLSGREGWRIRIGRYRVIYEIHDQILRIVVVAIGHRKDVYR